MSAGVSGRRTPSQSVNVPVVEQPPHFGGDHRGLLGRLLRVAVVLDRQVAQAGAGKPGGVDALARRSRSPSADGRRTRARR